MNTQELVYNRPNLIRSQVGSVSTFGCMLQFCIFLFFFLQLMCVQCRQKVKLISASVHSSIIAEHEREKESAIIMCVFSLVLAYVSGYILFYVHMYVLVCVCVRQGEHICVTVSICRWGVGVSCVLVCRKPRMLSKLQLGTAMVHVPCRKQQEQATYKLNGHTLKTSTFPLASSMSSRAMKQAIDMCILLGCQSEQEVQGIFRFI